MPKNYDIKTQLLAMKPVTNSSLIVGTAVATGKKRYVTFVSVHQKEGEKSGGTKLWLASSSTSTGADSTANCITKMKMALYIPSAVGAKKSITIPDQPDPENPLFSIAASNYLVAKLSKLQLGSTSCTLFVQYYDQ